MKTTELIEWREMAHSCIESLIDLNAMNAKDALFGALDLISKQKVELSELKKELYMLKVGRSIL